MSLTYEYRTYRLSTITATAPRTEFLVSTSESFGFVQCCRGAPIAVGAATPATARLEDIARRDPEQPDTASGRTWALCHDCSEKSAIDRGYLHHRHRP